jgi:hypothetical protein
VPTNASVCSGYDNLVSRDPSFASVEMSSRSIAGSVASIETALNAILRRLDTIEEKMQPLQPLQDQWPR